MFSQTTIILLRQRFWTIRAKHIILGTGSLERHIAFNNNDVPGMMTTNAAKHYLNRYGVQLGTRDSNFNK